MSTHSTDGREWARLSQLKPGDKICTDGGFSCGINNKTLAVKIDPETKDLCVECDEGMHSLDGQVSEEDGDHLVGMWPA